MWAEACEMLERAERLHRQFFQPAAGGRPVPTWEPPIDVVETAEEVAMIVALPGVDTAHIQVGIEEGALVVTGVRSMPPSYRSASIHRLEIPHGRFERRIPLTWQRLELRRREMINGCLLLSFRKGE
jgi:HSP20 family molecular chaperone IbpA